MILYRTTLDQLLVWLKDSYIGDHAPSIDVLAGGSHLRKRPVLLWSVQFWLESFRLALKCSKRPKRIEMPNVQKLLHFQGFRLFGFVSATKTTGKANTKRERRTAAKRKKER